jgi:hypothetical protein
MEGAQLVVDLERRLRRREWRLGFRPDATPTYMLGRKTGLTGQARGWA